MYGNTYRPMDWHPVRPVRCIGAPTGLLTGTLSDLPHAVPCDPGDVGVGPADVHRHVVVEHGADIGLRVPHQLPPLHPEVKGLEQCLGDDT